MSQIISIHHVCEQKIEEDGYEWSNSKKQDLEIGVGGSQYVVYLPSVTLCHIDEKAGFLVNNLRETGF